MASHRSPDDIMRLLERVVKRFPDNEALDGFMDKVRDGIYQVFPVGVDSVMVGQIHGDTVDIVAAAGNIDELLNFEPSFCSWYCDRGFKDFSLRGRRGWQRVLPELGWVHTGVGNEMVKTVKES